MSKLGGLIYIGAGVWIAMTLWQWWFRYPDYSSLAFGLLVGLGGLYMAYSYERMNKIETNQKEHKEANNDRYDGLWNEVDEIKVKLRKNE